MCYVGHCVGQMRCVVIVVCGRFLVGSPPRRAAAHIELPHVLCNLQPSALQPSDSAPRHEIADRPLFGCESFGLCIDVARAHLHHSTDWQGTPLVSGGVG